MLSRKNARVNSSTCKLFMWHREKWSFVRAGEARAQTHFASKHWKSCRSLGTDCWRFAHFDIPPYACLTTFLRLNISRGDIRCAWLARLLHVLTSDWCNVLGRWRVSNMSKICYPWVLLFPCRCQLSRVFHSPKSPHLIDPSVSSKDWARRQ